MNLFSANGISFSYPKRPLFKDLCLSLAIQEIATVLGPSGSGKTTLLRLIAGILTPQKGTIEVSAPLAYMGQDDLLLPWYTLEENLALFCKMTKSDQGPMKQLLVRLGLGDCGKAYPNELSKGMRQRGALARALLLNRPLLLLDEPFANLDAKIKEELHTLLLNLQKERGLSMLLITHDFNDAITLSNRILLLKEHQISKEWSIDRNLSFTEREALKLELKTAL